MNELFGDEHLDEKLTANFEEQQLDSFIQEQEQEAQQFTEVQNLIAMTDQDKKELKKSNEFMVQDFVQNIKKQIDPDFNFDEGSPTTKEKDPILNNIDEPVSEPKKKKQYNKSLVDIAREGKGINLPPGYMAKSLRILALTMEGSDNPVVDKMGKQFKYQADLVGGFIEGFSNFALAFPKKYEGLAKDTFFESKAIENFNKKAREEMEKTFFSSGDSTANFNFEKPVEVDIPRVMGNVAGFAAPIVGTGFAGAGVAGSMGLGAVGKGVTVAASEMGLAAVLTDKESGTLTNLLENFNVIEREVATKIPFYVDKDDTELMASLKGAGEALAFLGLPVAGVAVRGSVKPLIKTMQKTGGLVRDSISFKHLNKNPNLLEDFVREATIKPFKKGTGKLIAPQEKSFKNYVVRDFVAKEIDTRAIVGHEFVEDGSILVGSKKGKSLKAADEVISDMGESLDESTSELVDKFKRAVSDNNEEQAQVVLKELKNKKVTNPDLNDYVEFMGEYRKVVDNIKKKDPKTYKGISDVISNKKSVEATKAEIEDGSFLALMGKDGSNVGDLIDTVKKSGLSKTELDRVSKAIPSKDPKKISDVEVDKVRKDLIEVHGHDSKKVNELHKEGVIDLVEFTAHKQYILKQAILEAADSGKRITDFSPNKNSLADKRTLQLLQIKHQADIKGLQQVMGEFRQLRHDLGASFRLLQPRVREKMMSSVAELKAKDLLSEDTQLFLMDKILNIDDVRLNNVAKKLDTARVLFEKGDADSMSAAFKMIDRAKDAQELADNLQKFAYNNFLANISTFTTNLTGLLQSVGLDKFSDFVLKNVRPQTYHGVGKLPASEAIDVVSALRSIEAENATNLGLMANSKFYTNLRNVDGSIKSGTQVAKDSFIAGRSVVDHGSEKFGHNYTRAMTKEDKALSETAKASETNNDQAVKMFIEKNIEADVNASASDTRFFKSKASGKYAKAHDSWNKLADLHSLPLGLLAASDDAFKVGVLQRKHHRIISEKIGKQMSSWPDEKLLKFRQKSKLQKRKILNTMYKKELKDLDNFEAAKIEARDPTWTTKYRKGVDQPFSIGVTEKISLPVSDYVGAMERVPVLKLLHPFARIGLNITDWMTQHTPGMGALNNKVRADLAAGGYRRDKAIMRQASGLAFGKMCLYLIDKGVINGDYSQDPKMKASQIAMGFKPNSLNLNDEISIPLSRVEPIGSFCTNIANIRNKMIYHHNNEEKELADKGMALLSDSVKVISHTASPKQLSEAISTISFLLGDEEIQSHKGRQKVGEIIRNLTTRATPKFLFLNPNWFPERTEGSEKKQLSEYNQQGIDWGKTLNNYLYSVPLLGYLATPPEPSLDYFGDPINRYNVPEEMLPEIDQFTSDLWFSPFVSESLYKQKKLDQRPIWKELRRLDNYITEEFKTGAYYKDAEEPDKRVRTMLNKQQGYVKGFRLMPGIPRSLSSDNRALKNYKIKLNNKQYNELKNEFSYGKGDLKAKLEDEILRDEYAELTDLEKAYRIRNLLHTQIKRAVKRFKANNKIFKQQEKDALIKLYTEEMRDSQGIE
tara:strand:+ start:9402 stop:14054 length:4653 start_codon:yes stop_codon:yes gene_type:complete